MSKQDNVIKLLLIEDAVDEAEQLISMLRNGGIAVRPARATSKGAPDEEKAEKRTRARPDHNFLTRSRATVAAEVGTADGGPQRPRPSDGSDASTM